MTIEELNKSRIPIIPFDKKLEELSKKVLAPKKLELANSLIRKYGVPKTK
jgi:hypothetical protein